jgi:hypothetical protein
MSALARRQLEMPETALAHWGHHHIRRGTLWSLRPRVPRSAGAASRHLLLPKSSRWRALGPFPAERSRAGRGGLPRVDEAVEPAISARRLPPVAMPPPVTPDVDRGRGHIHGRGGSVRWWGSPVARGVSRISRYRYDDAARESRGHETYEHHPGEDPSSDELSAHLSLPCLLGRMTPGVPFLGEGARGTAKCATLHPGAGPGYADAASSRDPRGE